MVTIIVQWWTKYNSAGMVVRRLLGRRLMILASDVIVRSRSCGRKMYETTVTKTILDVKSEKEENNKPMTMLKTLIDDAGE